MPDWFSGLSKIDSSQPGQAFWTKRFPKRYMIMYLGVDEEFLGLGSALAYPFLKKRRSVKPQLLEPWFIKKPSRATMRQVQRDKHEYGLFELDL